ncbi:3523_t:CDS:2 [Diversispora eburnea]|uniref:RNA-dependent RNA polymerase n=1 Tax=Diversispora eburnea TaxID=1213867 RepID=A0A9N9C8A6_9GLOM|nr:3523_t:CDS:2 [Diversispora eburnea]
MAMPPPYYQNKVDEGYQRNNSFRRHSGNGGDKPNVPRNYKSFKEVSFKVFNLRKSTTASELRDFFNKYSPVFMVKIDTKDDNGCEPIGSAPPPTNHFWKDDLNFNGQKLELRYRDSSANSPQFYDNTDGKYKLKQNVFSVECLELGVFLQKDIFVRELKYTDRLSFIIDYEKRNIQVLFGVQNEVSTFKLELQFKDIASEFISEWDEVNDRSHVYLTIENKFPAKYSMLDTSMKVKNKFSWSLNDHWRRKTEIRTNRPDDNRNIPLQLNMPNHIDLLGKVIVFRITFNLQQIYGIKEFESMLMQAGEYNLASKPFELNPRLKVIPGDKLQKHVDRSMLDFDLLYWVESNLSHNYLHDYNLSDEFYKILVGLPKHMGLEIIETFSSHKRREFEPLKYLNNEVQKQKNQPRKIRNVPPYCVMMRKVVVTPTTMYILPPTMETSNRVIRHFKSYKDNFLRVQFTDEASGTVGSSIGNNANNALYNRIYNVLLTGIKIGDRHYEFLAFSSSQLREHSCWFFAPAHDLTADDIRAWMGEFSSIRNVAKYAARMGQCFSSTRAIAQLRVTDIKEIHDIERNKYNFSDGTGKISPNLAKHIATTLELKTTPCAFQFRLAGYKGVLCISKYLRGQQIQVRPSQLKFESNHNVLEIIRGSCMITAYLNRQAITLLSTLGIADKIFIDMKDEQVAELDKMLKSDPTAIRVLQQNIDEYGMTRILADLVKAGFLSRRDPYLVNLISLFRIVVLRDLKKKAKIRVSDGAFLLGVLDETESLKEDEIYVCKSDPNNPNARHVFKGTCIVFRNPCFHPGDIRVVTAVECKNLDHLIDVAVFPSVGYRDIPSQCSGGDLDGDDFTVIHDPRLIPRGDIVEAMNYEAPKPAFVPEVTIDHVKKFFVNYILSDQLGQIANSHLVKADKAPNGAFHGECIRLAQLHSEAVDFPKTGIPAEFPPELRSRDAPDFMEKPDKPYYESQKVLGKLYRSIVVDEFNPYTDIKFDERFSLERFQGTFEHYLEDSRKNKRDYDAELRGLMNQFGISSEYEVASGFIVKPTVRIERNKPRDVQKSVADNANAIKRQYRKIFEKGFDLENVISPDIKHQMEAKAFAWYYVTYHPSEMGDDPSERMITFPWINSDILINIVTGSSAKNVKIPKPNGLEKNKRSSSNFRQENFSTINNNDPDDDGLRNLRESLQRNK